MMRQRDDLEAEGQHVGNEPGLDDLVGVDVLLLAMRKALGEKAVDRAERLQERSNGQITCRSVMAMVFPPRPERALADFMVPAKVPANLALDGSNP